MVSSIRPVLSRAAFCGVSRAAFCCDGSTGAAIGAGFQLHHCRGSHVELVEALEETASTVG